MQDLPCALVVAAVPVALSSLQHTADIFDNAGCVVQLASAGIARCEASAAKINDHPDYVGAPTIGCGNVSDCYLTPHLYGRAVLAGAVLLFAPSEADMVAPYCNRCVAPSNLLFADIVGCTLF